MESNRVDVPVQKDLGVDLSQVLLQIEALSKQIKTRVSDLTRLSSRKASPSSCERKHLNMFVSPTKGSSPLGREHGPDSTSWTIASTNESRSKDPVGGVS